MSNFSWDSDQGARMLIEHLPDGIFVIQDERIIYLNQQVASMLGYPIKAIIGRPFVELIAPEDQKMVLERYQARLAGKEIPKQYDVRLLTANRSVIYCSLNVGLKKNEEGTITSVCSIRDISQQKAEIAGLAASEMELKAIFNQLPDVFYRTDMQGIITMISQSCYEVLGYRQEDMLGTPMAGYYETPEERQKVVQAITDGKGKATRVEAALKHKNGSTVWISTNANVRLDADNNPIYIEGVARDVSERKRIEDQLVKLTRVDVLTEVYNRRHFMDKCDEVIKLMRRYQRPVSVMMMDLDHFKNINDNYGHHIGDLALIAFTRACQKIIRESDVIGRLGGEEFGLMLPETPIQNAQALAERIRQATEAILIPTGDSMIKITVSIGLVSVDSDEQSLDDILRTADKAMYQAKDNGRNRVVTLTK